MQNLLLLTAFISTLVISDINGSEPHSMNNGGFKGKNSNTAGSVWWTNLWPTGHYLGEMESDDKKMHYGYTRSNGPITWRNEYPICGGKHQSPIDINIRIMQTATASPLYWTSSFWVPPTTMTIRNSGHTIELSGEWSPNKAPELRGGPLNSGYTFWQMHFHWGMEDDRGSEHTVNNRSYPLEAHAVHYKTEYGSPKTALKYPDGLAVVGFIFQMSTKAGGSLSPIIPALPGVQENGKTVSIEPVALSNLLAPPKTYATYRGSLTTPPCSEGVTWLVSGASLPVSKEQLEVFRTMSTSDGDMGDNFRPTQPLNGRNVFYVS